MRPWTAGSVSRRGRGTEHSRSHWSGTWKGDSFIRGGRARPRGSLGGLIPATLAVVGGVASFLLETRADMAGIRDELLGIAELERNRDASWIISDDTAHATAEELLRGLQSDVDSLKDGLTDRLTTSQDDLNYRMGLHDGQHRRLDNILERLEDMERDHRAMEVEHHQRHFGGDLAPESAPHSGAPDQADSDLGQAPELLQPPWWLSSPRPAYGIRGSRASELGILDAFSRTGQFGRLTPPPFGGRVPPPNSRRSRKTAPCVESRAVSERRRDGRSMPCVAPTPPRACSGGEPARHGCMQPW